MRPSRSGPALLVIAIMAILVLPGNILTDAAVPNLDTPEDTPIIGLPISLAAPGITNPVVTVTTLSTNALLLPASSVVIAGRGTDRTLSIYPGPDQYGVATVFLVAQEPDSSDAVTNRFTVTVDPVKDPPVILPVPDVLWFEGAPQPPIQVTVRYVEGIPPTLFEIGRAHV